MVMSDVKKQSDYRDGQNVIRDGRTRAIVYLPPEAKDVPKLMTELVRWINHSKTIPCPIVASIAHYQFATIHPYYDGNGRTARLLTTLILHLGGYDLKGLYSLEEYYARHLTAYYEAISVGPSHNYYEGRAEADITQWIEYFVNGMALACENVLKHMNRLALRVDNDDEALLRTLDPKKRKVLTLFQTFAVVTAAQIGQLFGFKPRTSAQLCKNWVEDGFLMVVNPSNKNRSYRLSSMYEVLITSHK
jgi:Fic family protein